MNKHNVHDTKRAKSGTPTTELPSPGILGRMGAAKYLSLKFKMRCVGYALSSQIFVRSMHDINLPGTARCRKSPLNP